MFQRLLGGFIDNSDPTSYKLCIATLVGIIGDKIWPDTLVGWAGLGAAVTTIIYNLVRTAKSIKSKKDEDIDN